MSSDQCTLLAGRILFRVGQLLLAIGIFMTILGMSTSHWVVRPNVNYSTHKIQANSTLVTQNFGLFIACRQSEYGQSRGQCGSIWENTNFVSKDTVRFIQFLSVVAGILFVVGVALEIVQLLPISKYRNFLAENRLVEMFSGIGTVVMLTSMVIFAGEVKNKAERVSGQEDEKSGWSFIVALMGLTMCVLGLVLVTMLRDLPIKKAGQKGGTWLRVASRASGQRA
ncbi:hypothetical protein ElyMa_000226400 [Elysia marginata]|uniref:Uncharacterized protein n=1 Tax=Elysia marginata TaxID=1093978 RepID=A0AAV4EZG6_9GAST|nr:hypothetical protein ElyMa_000226400 [Elysia marginata]